MILFDMLAIFVAISPLIKWLVTGLVALIMGALFAYSEYTSIREQEEEARKTAFEREQMLEFTRRTQAGVHKLDKLLRACHAHSNSCGQSGIPNNMQESIDIAEALCELNDSATRLAESIVVPIVDSSNTRATDPIVVVESGKIVGVLPVPKANVVISSPNSNRIAAHDARTWDMPDPGGSGSGWNGHFTNTNIRRAPDSGTAHYSSIPPDEDDIVNK